MGLWQETYYPYEQNVGGLCIGVAGAVGLVWGGGGAGPGGSGGVKMPCGMSVACFGCALDDRHWTAVAFSCGAVRAQVAFLRSRVQGAP